MNNILPYELQSLAYLQGMTNLKECAFVVESIPNNKLILLVRFGTKNKDAYALQQVRPVAKGVYKVREFTTLDGAANVLKQAFGCTRFEVNIDKWLTTSERKKMASKDG